MATPASECWRASYAILLTRLDFGGDETDVIDARAAHDIDCTRYLGKVNVVITLYKSDLVRAFFEDIE
jgi:hypothetical protein